MSVQFGRWNFEGQPPAPEYIEKVSATLAPYGPDSNESYSKGGVKILYRAFHTTKESHREVQPHVTASGAVITWDGRLDNRAELISELRDSLTICSTDVSIVAAAYEKWGADCFAKLIGDWALSIWNPVHRSVLLAKDPIGTKHLYYSMDSYQISWSSILDPLVRFAGKTFSICEEYIAAWFSCCPATHLTPYAGIHAAPASCWVLLRPGKHIVNKYWDFDPDKRIRYRTDSEYEEHFRTVFAKAVQRRLRSDRPVLAELSGGMDSSPIVCMADLVIARGQAECPRLDTISWYDDSIPDFDERPYFTKVEEKRGRVGYHIDLGTNERREKFKLEAKESVWPEFESDRLAVTPHYNNHSWPGIFEHYVAYMRSQEYRVTLSGLGGEQTTGGFVPTPRAELQNLLARARFPTLARQLKAWAAKMRKSRLPVLWDAVRGFFPRSLTETGLLRDIGPFPWLHPGLVRRNHSALFGYSSRVKLFGPLPSFQRHMHDLNHTRRVLAYLGGIRRHLEVQPDVRYPYLDRDMLEFAYAIPQEQLVHVGQRRFLMKRALVGIVPDQVLKRKPRAGALQEPKKDRSTDWPTLAEIGHHIISASLGITDANRFLETLQRARHSEGGHIEEGLMRTLTLEAWLHHLSIQRVLTHSIQTASPEYSRSFEGTETPGIEAIKKFS